MYAAAGLPEYWLVNIPDRRVEVYRSPVAAEASYAMHTASRAGETLQFETRPRRLLRRACRGVVALIA